jgi:hypothetical protein
MEVNQPNKPKKNAPADSKKLVSEPETIRTSDQYLEGYSAPECVEFGFHHLPEDELAVNGLNYTIKIGEKTFRVEITEVQDLEAENEKPMATYLASGENFLNLVQDRHLLIEEIQAKVLDALTLVSSLFSDIKVKKE